MKLYLNATAVTATHLLFTESGWVQARLSEAGWVFCSAEDLLRWLRG